MISLKSKYAKIGIVIIFIFSCYYVDSITAPHISPNQSQYTVKPPIIDGEANFHEWSGSGEIWNDIGVIDVKNDGSHLYLLIDVIQDTYQDEIPILGEDGDSVFIAFDVDLDSNISSTDIEFSYNPTDGATFYSNFMGPQQWTDVKDTFRSQIAPGFGSTNNKIEPHRFWEASISLDEIKSKVGKNVRIGIEINSATPEFGYQTPVNYTKDFTDLNEIQVQRPPQYINHIQSSAWDDPVVLDGYITNVNEWQDSKPVYLTLIPSNEAYGSLNAAIWAKNTNEYIFFLVMVEANQITHNDDNGIGIQYEWIDDETGRQLHDESAAFFGGITTDWCRLSSGFEGEDIDSDKGGRNDVKARSRYEGTTYWFELSKPLNSGDGCDWILVPDKFIGEMSESLYLVFWDQNEDVFEYRASMSLSLHNETVVSIPNTLIEGPIIDDPAPLSILSRFLSQPLYAIPVLGLGVSIFWFVGKRTLNSLVSSQKTETSIEGINNVSDNQQEDGLYTIDDNEFIPIDVVRSRIRKRIFEE